MSSALLISAAGLSKVYPRGREHVRALDGVTFDVAEKGIEVGRQLMAEMIAGYSQVKREADVETHHAAEGTSAAAAQTTVLNEVPSVQGTHA